MFLLSCGRESTIQHNVRECGASEQPVPSEWTYETFLQHQETGKERRRSSVALSQGSSSKPSSNSRANMDKRNTIAHQRASPELHRRGSVVDRIDTAMQEYDRAVTKLQAEHRQPSGVQIPVDAVSKDTGETPVPSTNVSRSSLLGSQRPHYAGFFTSRDRTVLSPRPSTMVPTRRLLSDHTDVEALDELPIPDHHVGLYEFYCRPNTWSPAFAAPGDFTVRMANVQYHNGDVVFDIAVICSCVLRVASDQPARAIKRVSKRKSFVKHIKRTHSELVKFMDAMSLAYLGHAFAEKVPPKRQGLLFGVPGKRELTEMGDRVVQLLTDVLLLNEQGFNRLVPLQEPVLRHTSVRAFLDLAAVAVSDVLLLNANNSCDARLERPEERPLLPSAWLDLEISVAIDGSQGANHSFESIRGNSLIPHTPKKSCYFAQSPRVIFDDLISRSFNRFDTSSLDVIPYHLTRSHSCDKLGRSSTPWGASNKCIRFVPPNKWIRDGMATDGGFTIEISSIQILKGHAHYQISVLYYNRGVLEVNHVQRRFSQFCELVQTIDQKLPLLYVSKLLPSKTLLRSLNAAYLEHRAKELQRFLELFLQLKFLGALEEEIPMVAEPNVRHFLSLPSVEWTLVPWKKDFGGTRSVGAATLEWKLARQAVTSPSMSSLSPTAQVDFSPRFSLVSPHVSTNALCSGCNGNSKACHEPIGCVEYQSIGKRRSDSM